MMAVMVMMMMNPSNNDHKYKQEFWVTAAIQPTLAITILVIVHNVMDMIVC